MVRNLDGEGAQPATSNGKCLCCHATGGTSAAAARGERFWIGDGVGCESCHGQAEHWLAEHYRWPENFTAAQKTQAGMKDLTDLTERAKVCVACHVGTADGDVNHDLIAAGHPRLNFEFSGFLAIYPRHWPARQEDEARVWAVGQAESAAAALRLLAARADDTRKPWPEFAEYNCYACHKDLTAELPAGRSTPAGSLPWGTWYFALSRELVQPGQGLAQLRKAMQSAASDREAVAQRARELAVVFEGWPAKTPRPTSEWARRLMAELTADAPAKAGIGWDEACQTYLALAALNPYKADGNNRVRDELQKMGAELRGSFEPGFDSPRRFGSVARPHFAEHLKALREALRQD
jgi:hypothetical protein